MSDALLTRIAEAVEGLRADLKKTGTAPTSAPKTSASAPPRGDANAIASDATKSAAEKKAAADKAIAERKAKKDAETAAAAKAGGAKGKHTIEQVRELIRKVAADVDKQTAKDILKDDGGGAEKVLDLSPKFYDAVYEACEVVLRGEGSSAAASAEEDDFA